jgi:phosphoribosylaminoimidazole-succinocarboxamide synthase
VRNHLSGIGWDREPPIRALPDEIVERTAARYREIRERLAA